MRGEFVELDRLRLYYYAAGSRGVGDPVVFLHGFPTSGHLWRDLIPRLPAGRRYVVPDLAGSGRSSGAGSRDLSLARHAARVLLLLDALGIPRATLVGHGIGALVAVETCRLASDRLNGVALVNPADPTAPLRGLGAVRLLRPLLGRLDPGLGASLLHAVLRQRFLDEELSAHSADHYARAFLHPGGRGLLGAHCAALSPPVEWHAPSMLGDGALRTSIVCGVADRRDSRCAAAFARRVPSATFHQVDGAGHFLPEEAPEHLAAVLAPWFP